MAMLADFWVMLSMHIAGTADKNTNLMGVIESFDVAQTRNYIDNFLFLFSEFFSNNLP